MACYHPLYAMVTGLTDNGKKAIRIYSAIELPNFKRAHPEIKEWLTIPCGKCIGFALTTRESGRQGVCSKPSSMNIISS